jgi:hypothetical protein
MAYMSQEKKAKIAPVVKAILKKYGVKGTLSVRTHSTLVLNITSGKLDFIKNYNDNQNRDFCGEVRVAKDHLSVNTSGWYKQHYTGEVLDFLNEVITAMNDGNFDKSDIQSDYFYVGWYIDVNVGKWDRPYELTK